MPKKSMVLIITLLSSLFMITQGKYTVLTSDFPPMVHCELGARSNTFKGIDMDIFREIASKLKWSYNDWEFLCINFDDIKNYIKQTDNYLGYIGRKIKMIFLLLSTKKK